MKITLSKEQMVNIGKAGLKIGKTIIIEGTKAVIVKGTTKVVMEGLDNGLDGIKNMSLDTVLGKTDEDKPEKVKKDKKGFFKRKKKEVEAIEVSIENNEDTVVVEADIKKGTEEV